MTSSFISAASDRYADAGMWLWAQAQGGNGGNGGNGGGLPGSNLQPTAPPGVGDKINILLNWAQWVCFAAALLGTLATIAGVVISRRNGDSDEATSSIFRIGIGVSALAGVGGLFSWFAGT